MKKLPRNEVIERQLESIQDTFERIDDAAMDKLRGGQMQARYGIAPRLPPPEPPVDRPVTEDPAQPQVNLPLPTVLPAPERK